MEIQYNIGRQGDIQRKMYFPLDLSLLAGPTRVYKSLAGSQGQYMDAIYWQLLGSNA